MQKEFSSLVEIIADEITTGRNEYAALLRNDPIRDRLTVIFEGLVGDEYSDEDLFKLYAEGKKRYERRALPPGYKDDKKPEHERYGDLIVWRQLLDKAIREEKSIIFVTDDAKDDWWQIINDERLGPRAELREEFRRITGEDIYIYSTEHFMRNVTRIGKNISVKALKEVEAATKLRDDLFDKAAASIREYWGTTATGGMTEHMLWELGSVRDARQLDEDLARSLITLGVDESLVVRLLKRPNPVPFDERLRRRARDRLFAGTKTC